MTPLPSAFLNAPIAHRALHDVNDGRPENSRAAIRAAIEQRYGIEIDLQLSSDGQAMVFHDYDLTRLAEDKGAIRLRAANELQNIPLRGGNEGIPTFSEVLEIIGGKVPLLIEIKDQDGAMGPRTGVLEQAAAECLKSYEGDVAIMSFNPHAVLEFAKHRDDLPLGLVTCAYLQEDWPLLPAATRNYLRDIPDFDRVGASFISHDVADLGSDAVTRLQDRGTPILCWTVQSREVEHTARAIADNITFEGYEA
ncbi:glycerophosphodiester phosphodiesterase family protein [Aliiroseovarius sp. KMU-50]|uniref:Glycerophosphodiester phosphodiesterase family protein n=1 Tax=Aliiroseovarius salicola TaxID=3009082 RepID=A0ABT4VYH8_9RHOB|nr:glycerophosphodiester phosphodiesterase family protein [Aliiroseovarius sp. KMU-50]MDA5092627.1 glycerophosphodiester phosphodiesterase family protein [Aliiroseovarius sp. KMU-50]